MQRRGVSGKEFMRIGIVTTWFERGAAYVSKAFRDALSAEGHDVFIYARGGESAKGDPDWDGSEVVWAKPTFWTDESGIDLRHFRQWLVSMRIDKVLFNEQRTWRPVLECQKLGIPSVAYVDYYRAADVPLFKNYDALICNTKRHFSVFEWHPGARYVPWGVDIGLFKPEQEGRTHSENKVVFFHSCGMSPVRKGTDLLIRAFDALPAESSELIIHSQKDIFELLPKAITNLAVKLQQDGRLKVVNRTVPAPGLYHLGDVYVYPTRLEGIGLTICEAMACGLPAIVPDNPPMSEFIEDDRCGRKVKVAEFHERSDGYYWPSCCADVEDLSAAMSYYLDKTSELDEIRKSVRDYVVRRYNWQTRSGPISSVFKDAQVLTGALRAEGVEAVQPMMKKSARVRSLMDTNVRRVVRSIPPLKKMYDRICALREVSQGG